MEYYANPRIFCVLKALSIKSIANIMPVVKENYRLFPLITTISAAT
jgi:hypothetical protein